MTYGKDESDERIEARAEHRQRTGEQKNVLRSPLRLASGTATSAVEFEAMEKIVYNPFAKPSRDREFWQSTFDSGFRIGENYATDAFAI